MRYEGAYTGYARNFLAPGPLKQIQFLTPKELFTYIEGLEAESAGKQERVRGNRVKVLLLS